MGLTDMVVQLRERGVAVGLAREGVRLARRVAVRVPVGETECVPVSLALWVDDRDPDRLPEGVRDGDGVPEKGEREVLHVGEDLVNVRWVQARVGVWVGVGPVALSVRDPVRVDHEGETWLPEGD